LAQSSTTLRNRNTAAKGLETELLAAAHFVKDPNKIVFTPIGGRGPIDLLVLDLVTGEYQAYDVKTRNFRSNGSKINRSRTAEQRKLGVKIFNFDPQQTRGTMADYTELKNKIKKHEGYRDHIYLDSLSIPTFGYGHMVLPTDDLVEGKHYPIEVAEEYFDKDFNIAVKGAEELIGEISLNFIQKCCIIQMVYQLGKPRTSKFKKMWQALKDGDIQEASAQILDSLWNKQTPGRCAEVASEMASSSI